jgi:aminoglycoside N3'-acetyltransferase
VLLLGVGHSANTTLHLAESLALVPYRARKSCVVARDGAQTRVEYDETDHCCERFARVDEWLVSRVGNPRAPRVSRRPEREARRPRIPEGI